jgi:hypothetical protein
MISLLVRSRDNAVTDARLEPPSVKPAAAPERLETGIEGDIVRDEVDDDVDALAAGQLAEGLGHVGGRGVDAVVGAGLAAGVELLRPGVDGDDAGMRPFRQHQQNARLPPAPITRPCPRRCRPAGSP